MKVLYGEAASERRASENTVCRQIISTINNFGITQRQSLLLIYLLASELENVEHMRAITSMVRELGGSDMFISGAPEHDVEVRGDIDGSLSI